MLDAEKIKQFKEFLDKADDSFFLLYMPVKDDGKRVFEEHAFKKRLKRMFGEAYDEFKPEDIDELRRMLQGRIKSVLSTELFKEHLETYYPSNEEEFLRIYKAPSGGVVPTLSNEAANIFFLRELKKAISQDKYSVLTADKYQELREMWDAKVESILDEISLKKSPTKEEATRGQAIGLGMTLTLGPLVCIGLVVAGFFLGGPVGAALGGAVGLALVISIGIAIHVQTRKPEPDPTIQPSLNNKSAAGVDEPVGPEPSHTVAKELSSKADKKPVLTQFEVNQEKQKADTASTAEEPKKEPSKPDHTPRPRD